MFATPKVLNRFVICLVAAAVCMTIGCRGLGSANINPDETPDTMRQMSPEPIRIIYRTKTDRLNLSGASLPPCSMATLHIQAPHPHYQANAGYARLVVAPCSADAELMPEDLATILQQTTEKWEGDISLWQIESVVAQLKTANFFRRAKILQPNSFLAVDVQAGRLGKRYRDVAELDAIVVRLSNSDWPHPSSPDRLELARLPDVHSR